MDRTRQFGVGVSCALALATAAYAEPQETVTFNNVITEGALDTGGNTELTTNFTGAYTVTKLRFSGTLNSTTAGTWPDDSRIRVTTPSGQTILVHPFTTTGGFTSISTSGDFIINLTTPEVANGTWTFRFYESFDDTGVDAYWEPATFTLDDEAPPPPPPPATFQEVEPNDNKGAAQVVNGIAEGNTIGGLTLGNSTLTPGNGSSDYFKIKTQPQPLGIYRHRIEISTTGAAGHIGTIRGLTQTGGIINAGTDAAVQTASVATTPARTLQWYGFGKEEELYVAVGGTASTSSEYRGTYSRSTVTAIDAGTFLNGDITINPDPTNTVDADFMVYDGNFNALPGYSNDGGNTLTRNFDPGTYYIAFGNYNTCNDQAAPPDDTFPSENVLDFPNAVTNSSTAAVPNMNIQITDITGAPAVVTGSKDGFFDVVWYKIVVAPPTGPTNPRGNGSAAPASAQITGTSLLKVSVIGGFNPPSTGLAVQADLTSLNGGANQAFFDDGTHGDEVPGDNTFSYLATLAEPMTAGPVTIPFTVTDGQSRSGTGNINLTATAAPTGGCCIAGACQILTAYSCAQGSGTFNGDGSDCAGAFAPAGTSADAFPIAVPDSTDSGVTPGSASATITIPSGSGTIGALGVSVGINHTYVGDVRMSVSNGTTTVDLIYRPGVDDQPNETGNTCNYGGTYLFTDGVAADLWAATNGQATGYVVPSGTFHPSGINSPALPTPSLAAFTGMNFEGTWTLTVEDWWGVDTGSITGFSIGNVTPVNCGPVCGTSDFNGDGDFGTDQDIEAFFACLAGQCCPACYPGGSDFNGDGDFGTDQDIESFFRVLAGGNC